MDATAFDRGDGPQWHREIDHVDFGTRALVRRCRGYPASHPRVHDYAAKMRQEHPGRFGLFASLPLPDVEGSLREIAYALDELRADGIGLLTNYDGKYPGEAAFAPVFDELNRRKAVVYFHPAAAPCCALHGCNAHGGIGVPAATLDFPFDTTKAVTSLLFGGTFARCRDIRFIFSHAGGTIPFLAERIARLEARPE